MEKTAAQYHADLVEGRKPHNCRAHQQGFDDRKARLPMDEILKANPYYVRGYNIAKFLFEVLFVK